eukprot:TRINITY_DN2840_c0_g5_i2.p1 TRINITY_DN2840_c0_g5~~TRINITY_DN2840_c0_g5_i2.p1  ORF type:complete len:156 (+),score=42.71 TRINITY_DN2840_c0_g5_i2:50-469(+)
MSNRHMCKKKDIFIVVDKVSQKSLIRIKNLVPDGSIQSLINLQDTWYHISIATADGVKAFLPQLPYPPILHKDQLRDWLLTKCINGERSAINYTKAFSDRISHTRQKLLSDLVVEFKIFPRTGGASVSGSGGGGSGLHK